MLNSVALRLANISVDTPDPAGGMIDRDIHTGEPTGLLYEMGEFLSQRIPAPDNRSFLAGVELANRQLLRSGITSVHDASRSNGMDQWDGVPLLEGRRPVPTGDSHDDRREAPR